MHVSLRSRPFCSAASLLTACCALPGLAQAPHTPTEMDKQHIEQLIHGMSLDQKLDYIGGRGFGGPFWGTMEIPALHLPGLQMSDGPYGTRSNEGSPSTTYAAGIGLAASWDRDLAERVGAGIGRDARARGVHYMLGPGVNIYRSPLNGRNFEYFGEDPFLTSNIAAHYIIGMQQQGVSATIKHFVGNNSEYLRHDSDSIIEERALRELYLPSFEIAVKKAHVGAIMDSYNLINGAHATQNGYLNNDIVRKEWGFTGTMMSDWDATYDAVGAANGGLDIEMPNGKFMNRGNLEPAIKTGTVSQATIDDKVRHILTTAASFGWLDREQADPSLSYVDHRNQEAALDSARESIVLLKNEGDLLPLDRAKVKTILLVGPDAYPGVPVGGGSAGVKPFQTISKLQGMTDIAGAATNLLYDRGLPTLSELARDTHFVTAATGGKPGITLDSFERDDFSGQPAKTSVVPFVNMAGISWQTLLDDPEGVKRLFESAPAFPRCVSLATTTQALPEPTSLPWRTPAKARARASISMTSRSSTPGT